METLDAKTRHAVRPADRHTCAAESCFATFEGSPAHENEVRHCNRGGPDGGHPHQWDGQCWHLVAGHMEHDRT